MAVSASSQPSAYRSAPSLRIRLTALALSLAMSALVIFVLIRMGALSDPTGGAITRLTAIEMTPRSGAAPAHERTNAKKRSASHQASQTEAKASPLPVPVPTPQPEASPIPFKMIRLSRAEFAASDISKLSGHAADSATAEGSGSGGATYGPGEGPGGAQLYNAEWLREPSRAELVTYLPANSGPGDWAVIACRTIERNHVEDCRELAESPPGSGLARGLRRAAWQFLVRPPRLDGRPVLGAWVRIRFTYKQSEAQ